MISTPRSRRGGATLICGLDPRQVGHSASLVHPCSWQVHRISSTSKAFQEDMVLHWVWRDFVFFCCTTVRTFPFVSRAVSLDVQQYSRVQQKSLSINNPRSQHVCTIKVHTAVLQLNKKRKRRDGEIQLTLCPEWSALPLNQLKM